MLQQKPAILPVSSLYANDIYVDDIYANGIYNYGKNSDEYVVLMIFNSFVKIIGIFRSVIIYLLICVHMELNTISNFSKSLLLMLIILYHLNGNEQLISNYPLIQDMKLYYILRHLILNLYYFLILKTTIIKIQIIKL